ncbi:Protein NO VEIN [Linum grandiflorum]
MYCELDHEFWSNCKSGVENRFIFMQKLCSCEDWLVCQFGVNEFNSLGHDEFFVFLEKNVSFLPAQVRNFLGNEPCESPSLEVRILQDQLILLVSQASNNLWQNEPITKQMISAMFARQFPSLSANVTGDCSSERFLATVEKHKSCAISNSVLFSATLQESHHNLDQLAHSESRGLATSASAKMSISSVTSKAAIDVLLQAPMLSDLNLWSHWDLRFAQSLGSLQHFLSREVTTRELICLVTREGKVIRLRHSATADTFLEAAVQGSPFQTAVELLSFFSLTGGEKHVPLSLLKSYSCHAFGVILNIPTNNVDVQGCVDNYVVPVTGSKDLNTPVSVAARFFLDCIGYFPAEFRGFVADVLLAGMQSLTFEASSAIFLECSGAERLMLREIGLSIDVSEWVNDHDTSGVGSTHLPNISESLHMDVSRSELSTKPRCKQDVTNENRLASSVEFSGDNGVTNSSPAVDIALVSGQTAGSGLDSNNDKDKDAASVIDCIRRSEFGLIPNLSSLESDMLTKQHARLGRALHCLSQELYSQDSHFLLELVQNADDNTYPENMEPTLVFILEESGIVVLNNEHGFSPQNIKALCDVGNSTKKRSGAGYIGKKGIGFKSVFRVTDAPQIHSNGFHIKFDISVGQIGFVLPTVVSPCNVDFYNGLVSGGNDQLDSNCWNTCIVLPFRSKLLAETTMRMFVDLHPSLLLFLHRLKCIMFRNMLNNSLVIMRKEIVGDGIVNVTWGEDKMTWLVASQKLQAHSSRPKVQATEIAIAFTLKESENSYYTPCLEQQPVFAFLPLRAYGLKFILQGDFILTSSREEVDRNNPWNEWLLANFPLLFAAAEKSFCALSCFKEKPGKAVTTFMSFVPLLGEVHGFFSGLPRAISLKLSTTECLFLEGDATKMVKPDKVLRGWNEEARILLPEVLLQKHLGLGFLDQNIVLRDSLASVLGITQYGPDILIRFTTCLCRTGNGLQLMGMRWLSFLLDALYRMLPNSNEENSLLDSLRGLPFVPLSDGTYSSSDAGTIWLHSDVLSTGLHGPLGLDTFPKLYAELRIVNPVLLSASATNGASPHNIVRMLERIGVQPLSAHEIMKLHIFQSISDFSRDRQSMTDYLCFLMIHIQSSCNMCHTERKSIMSELKSKAYILTNNGYKRLGEAPIHFSREFGNPIDVRKFNDVLKMEWNEVDVSYLKHPSIESLSGGLTKWREFLMEIGVTDFVQVVQTERSVTELSRAGINQMLCDAKLISPDHMAKDWESKELVHLLSLLSARNDAKCCEHVLDILDTLWDGSFSDKVSGFCNGNACDDLEPFKSSFISSLCDAQWLVSSIDNELHYPKDLFHDCETVRSILGSFAPYATPKVKSATLLADIGLKTKVGLTDALKIAEAWRKSNTPFKASISQMSRFYSFISEELVSSKKNVQEAFQSGPFIFVPFKTASKHNNLVSGVFLRPEEVYWDDPTGSLHQMKLLQQRTSTTMHQNPSDKTLCHVYPGLHDFFVNQCGVCETPSNSSYLDILRQLSTLAPPFEPASAVFKVFSKWGSGFKSGLLSSADLIHLKECLLKLEYTILPTASNKWMSLHTSFGVVCWCDNAELSKDFEHLDNINFLYFGKLKDNEEEILHKQVSELLRVLGIPALSEVISRQAIYYGPTDSSLKASLIHWALPYAQRYMYSIYPNNYAQLQQNGFEAVKKLKVVVVETLFYKNVIKRCGNSSQNRCECSCLLQDETLYSTMAADPHALFLELSRLFLNGTPDLHLANFLHMITTMAESGSTVDQTEFFILNCQKIPKLPEEEVVWSLGPSPSREKGETDTIFPMAMDEEETCIKPKVVSSTIENVSKSLKYQMKAGLRSNWPPADWKTAPGYGPHAGNSTLSTEKVADMILTQGEVPIIRDDSETSTYPGCEPVNDYLSLAYNNQTGGLDRTDQPQRLSSPSVFSRRDQFAITGGSSDQAMATGRLGEQIGFRYLTEKYGKEAVRWVNEAQETGLPYDMVVTEHGHGEQYIEVKATQSVRKDYFFISAREWQFAVEKGDAYTILHILLGNHNAMVTLFKNPVKQCQQGKLRLVVVMPTQQSGGELFPVLDA